MLGTLPRVFAEQKLEAEKRQGCRFSANPLRAQTLCVCDGCTIRFQATGDEVACGVPQSRERQGTCPGCGLKAHFLLLFVIFLRLN
jgi:hypothetical protein